ncbi:type II restriction endonuclease [Leisingera sp. JC1]|uniref:type II restriction endonuclease n=1 Tax=Leisingera sp. JC1 TaxID=1855282 RepID=UPI0009F2AD23|nr:type II restriction endonuclease [Leisingera sp. JC1]
MNKGFLSEYFTGAGTKILTRVDATPKSNQHEVGDGHQGQVLMRILGDQPRKKGNRFEAKFIWLSDEQETIREDGLLSWYDARANQPHRSPEWRLYYQSNAITHMMNEGDRLFVARRPDDTLLFIVVPLGSAIARQLMWLFGLDHQAELPEFAVHEIEGTDREALDFVARLILDEIGIEYEDPNANTIDAIIDRFGFSFPSTAEFSDLARLTLPEIDARDDPDAALIAWLDHEEAMFRRLENRIVARDIESGWVTDGIADVDAFIKYSLGVQNRRKSRMGHSFENHLCAVFDSFGIQYDRQVKTEKGKKPDYVFPGKDEYNNKHFPVGRLTMLAAKSTCKDRWPQVLPEAERIPTKHLVTLEPAISVSQTTTMQESSVQLVVPSKISKSYTVDQQKWLWSLSDFVELVSDRQRAA